MLPDSWYLEKPIDRRKEIVLGAGLEPACLSAYAPQTYVSAIPPPELCAPQNFRIQQPLASGASAVPHAPTHARAPVRNQRNEHNSELKCASVKSTDQQLKFPK
jgi:hypothetical protein